MRLDNLSQRGGGAMTIQSRDGLAFESIVFGEQEPGRWMAGSEGFSRYKSVIGAGRARRPEAAGSHCDHVRGRRHDPGLSRRAALRQDLQDREPRSRFTPGEAVILFGQRHTPAGGNRGLAGTLMRARLYDRALEPREVAASAASFREYIPAESIIAALTPDRREERGRILAEIERLRTSVAANPRVYAVAPREAGATHVEIRGNPNQPGEVVSPGRDRGDRRAGASISVSKPDAPEARRRERLAAWVCEPAQSAVRPRRGQSALAGAFRDRLRRDGERFRLQRRQAVAPGAARLAGRRDRREKA